VGVQVTPLVQNKLPFFDIKEKYIMNTQLAFAFGMLAMSAIIIIGIIIVGMVKVIRQGNTITSLEKWIDSTNISADNNMQVLERRISEEVRELSNEIAVVHQRISEIYSVMDSRFDKFQDKITKKQILKD
jgi:predicted PurR-regulated permease PerM